jgi:hypothetical protein
MGEGPQLTPVEYLDRFFDELRDEVRSNPKFAARLVEMLYNRAAAKVQERTSSMF